MKKNVLMLLAILSTFLFVLMLTYYKNKPTIYSSNLYSWNLDAILEDEKSFDQVLEDYAVKNLYQSFTKEYLKEKDDSFIKKMFSKGISVYHLGGDPAWGKKGGYDKIVKTVDRILEFNEDSEYKIRGVVLDIEPYVSEREEVFSKENFEIYAEQIEKSYIYCRENELEMIVAIPYWFDSIDENLLERIVSASDGISVMNYKIDKTASKIKEEVHLANKYGKKIDSIYEIEYQKEGYFQSLEAILKDFAELKKVNPSDNLTISYHHYGSIK